jgi:hypothetical protein
MAERVIKSFEPEDDVLRMLERASADGIRLGHMVNTSLREWLTKKGYARKKDLIDAEKEKKAA